MVSRHSINGEERESVRSVCLQIKDRGFLIWGVWEEQYSLFEVVPTPLYHGFVATAAMFQGQRD